MELLMSNQADPTPWPVPAHNTPSASTSDIQDSISTSDDDGPQPLLHGRGYFSELGVVRRKPCSFSPSPLIEPFRLLALIHSSSKTIVFTDIVNSTIARPDAPPTLSKSCTDKLSHHQATSLLSSLSSLLLDPSSAYLHTLVLPSSQTCPAACTRAFKRSGRMSPLVQQGNKWRGGYGFRPFTIGTTEKEFKFSRSANTNAPSPATNPSRGTFAPSNISAVYTPRLQETLINGVLQGRRQADPRSGSALCRRGMCKAVMLVLSCLEGLQIRHTMTGSGVATPSGVGQDVGAQTYKDLKDASPMLSARRSVKRDVREQALKGWRRNEGDDEWVVPQLDGR
ncbi:MAG: hypothetical protein M1837_004065 [Sclerophora amabilis]|nr:MAG: hypothetical protein M1837_004065 [Sclerophora amabilis]